MIINTEDKNPIMETTTPELPAIGEAICEIEIDKKTRDKLVEKFITIARTDLKEYDENLEIYREVIGTDPKGDRSIPRLIIHTKVENIKDVKGVLKTLREYFQIQGSLRLPTMGTNYLTDDGDISYFKDEETDLNLILDLLEYKCNNIYKETSIKMNQKI